MLPDKIEHCVVFMNYWDVSGVFRSFSKCNIKIPHLPTDPSIRVVLGHVFVMPRRSWIATHPLNTLSSVV